MPSAFESPPIAIDDLFTVSDPIPMATLAAPFARAETPKACAPPLFAVAPAPNAVE